MDTKMKKNKKFTFEISIDEVPYNEENAEYIYGGGYNSDIPEESCARELISTVLQDSLVYCLRQISKHLAECKCDFEDMSQGQQRFHKYLKKKARIAEAVRDSYKFVRSEEVS